MRHQKTRRRLQRHGAQRRALIKSLVTALFRYQRINTTQVKAKEAQKVAEQLITLGKNPTVHSRRQAFELLGDHNMVKKLFDEIAPLFSERQGGYTRVLRTGHRVGDAAPMAMLELVEKTSGFDQAAKERSERKKVKLETKKKQAETESRQAHQHHDHADNAEKTQPKSEGKDKSSPSDPQDKSGQKDQKSFVKNLKKFFKRKGQDS